MRYLVSGLDGKAGKLSGQMDARLEDANEKLVATRVLAAWPGALLLVSHDTALVRASTTMLWPTEPWPGRFRFVKGSVE